MDEVERLIEAFSSHGRRDQSVWQLDVLLDLGRIDDPRVVQFLVGVVQDAAEPPDVRIEALRLLREAPLTPSNCAQAARAGLRALTPESESQLRLHTAVVLGDFTDVDCVLAVLGRVAADRGESLELRYNAFTSVQRAGPTTACLDILRALSDDEAFGQSARALLTAWGAD
jgi:HEAT repeat protein